MSSSERLLFAGIVLAGGGGRRLGGVDKPGLIVGGQTLLDRAMASIPDVPVVVVGPTRSADPRVTFVREEPVGAGPAAALATGVRALRGSPGPDALVAVLAADLPAVNAASVVRLCAALPEEGPGSDGAVLVDPDGHEQLLLGVWQFGALQAACTARSEWTGVALRVLLAPLDRTRVTSAGAEAADIDTPDELRRWRSHRQPGPPVD